MRWLWLIAVQRVTPKASTDRRRRSCQGRELNTKMDPGAAAAGAASPRLWTYAAAKRLLLTDSRVVHPMERETGIAAQNRNTGRVRAAADLGATHAVGAAVPAKTGQSIFFLRTPFGFYGHNARGPSRAGIPRSGSRSSHCLSRKMSRGGLVLCSLPACVSRRPGSSQVAGSASDIRAKSIRRRRRRPGLHGIRNPACPGCPGACASR